MNFKTNKIILFCNRRITPQIAKNWGNTEYIKSLLNTVVLQAENEELSEIDFNNLINYLIYSLGNYYRGNTIFVFQLLVACLYLITPVDIVSDFLPGIGYIDDLMLFKMILDTYNNELTIFNKVKRDMLDIKYMRVDSKVIDGFEINPTEAIDLIIKDRQLETVNGEQLINQMIEDHEQQAVDQYLEIDVVESIKYELINHLLKSKTGEEAVDEELLSSLIQIPNIILKKDINYFLKNIDDIMSDQPIQISREKKAIFNTNVYNLSFAVEDLNVTSQIGFVQTESYYNNLRQQVLRYKTFIESKIGYQQIVEIIDLATQKHIFEQTIIYFDVQIGEQYIILKVDKELNQVTYITSSKLSNTLNIQLAAIANLIEERVM